MAKLSDMKKLDQKTRFISLRWRFISPLFVVVLVVAMVGAYFLAQNVAGGLEVSQQNLLLQSSRAVADRSASRYEFHRQEAQRAAFTVGVAEAVQDNDAAVLEPILRSLLRVNNLDNLIVTDVDGVEVLGLQRVASADGTNLALSTETDLGQEAIVQSVIQDGYVGATGFMRTPGGLSLFTAVPIQSDNALVGVVMVGQEFESLLNDLKASANAHLMLYGPDATLLQTTYTGFENRNVLTISQELFNQAALATRQIPVDSLQIESQTYQVAYQPFNFGPSTLGVIGTLMLDNIPYVTETGRQLTALVSSALAGAAVFVSFAVASRFARRADRVARVAGELAVGRAEARTGMQPSDEISAIGHALDSYADHAQEQQDSLRHALRRQRREFNHLMAVFESIPDGIVVQALDGRVLLMNDPARVLLGSQRVFRSSGLHELAQVVSDKLGPALAPGLYALGDPHRLHLDERILSAQAAAVLSMSEHRLGTVVLLRDITNQVRIEREREIMLQRLARDIQQPLASLGRMGAAANADMIGAFAREMTRQAVALQKMIIDMRELDNINVIDVKRRQRSMRLETLIWAVANEWRQIAQAHDLTMHIIIERKGLHVLGDEKRLRWALGNIVDNAIKYTIPGGALTLEIQGETDGMANLRVRDNGVGIQKEDRQYVFTRFFRGTPATSDGTVIRVPGMGQGLHIARQIFESHGGMIRIKSTPGVGTAVYMSLPLTSPMSMELPQFEGDMEGETVQLPEGMLVDVERGHFPSNFNRRRNS